MKYNFFDKKKISFLLVFITVLIFLFVLFKSYKVALTNNNPDTLPTIKSNVNQIKVKIKNDRADKSEQNSFYDGLSNNNENFNISILEHNDNDLSEYDLELKSKVNDSNINNENNVLEDKNTFIKDNFYKVQLIALKNREQAIDYINSTKRTYSELLKNLNIFILETDLGEKGIFYRVQVGNFTEKSSADNFCSEYLKRSNKNLINCIVVR